MQSVVASEKSQALIVHEQERRLPRFTFLPTDCEYLPISQFARHKMLAARSRIGQCWRSLSWIQQQQQPQRAFSAAASKSAAAVETQASTSEAGADVHSPEASTSTWTPESQRTGVLAKKLGMSAMYDSAGVRTPVTVLQVRLTYCQIK